MKAEILSIGSELTSGRNLDTNSQWLSRKLAEIGIAVGWHTTIADDLTDNIEAFRIAIGRAGLIIATGGLGPTQDDLTREVLARVAGAELVFHEESFQQIEAMFRRRRRVMPERNRVQALLPAGAEPIANALGTAPGIWMHFGAGQGSDGAAGAGTGRLPEPRPRLCTIVAMPGVPSEMFAMFETEVKPRLVALGLGGGVLVERKINTFGAGESAIEEKLLDLTRRDHVPEVGITASDATISLRILARAPTREQALSQIAPVERTICERLGSMVYGFDDGELHDAVGRLLADKRQSLATAEGVSAGLVAQRLSRTREAHGWFRGGAVVADPRGFIEMLAVPQTLIDEHGLASAEVAKAMAVGCRTRWRTDLAVSTTGIATSEGSTPDKPAGLVHVGLAWNGGSDAVRFTWGGALDEIQSRTAKMALNRARLHLLGPRG